MADTLTIRGVTARAVIAPMKRPIRTAVGVIPAAPLVLVDVSTEEGVTGRAYAFAYTPLALAPLVRLIEDIGAAPALTVTFLIPLFGTFFGWLVLDETVGWHTLAGGAVVIAGTALVTGFSPRMLAPRKEAANA